MAVFISAFLKNTKSDNNDNESSSSYCLNGGKLYENQSCICTQSFTGTLCEKPKCSDYCMNNARCRILIDYEQNVTKNNKSALPKCICNSNRYFGQQCQFDTCIRHTSSSSCDKKNKNCFLDSNCTCKCDSECDKDFCSGKGVCLREMKGKQLSCR